MLARAGALIFEGHPTPIAGVAARGVAFFRHAPGSGVAARWSHVVFWRIRVALSFLGTLHSAHVASAAPYE